MARANAVFSTARPCAREGTSPVRRVFRGRIRTAYSAGRERSFARAFFQTVGAFRAETGLPCAAGGRACLSGDVFRVSPPQRGQGCPRGFAAGTIGRFPSARGVTPLTTRPLHLFLAFPPARGATPRINGADSSPFARFPARGATTSTPIERELHKAFP